MALVYGVISSTVGKWVRYRAASRVSRRSLSTAACAPMKKCGSVEVRVPPR
jgi:hypothetical protein